MSLNKYRDYLSRLKMLNKKEGGGGSVVFLSVHGFGLCFASTIEYFGRRKAEQTPCATRMIARQETPG